MAKTPFRMVREAAGLTQAQVCERLGYSMSVIGKIDRGDIPVSKELGLATVDEFRGTMRDAEVTLEDLLRGYRRRRG